MSDHPAVIITSEHLVGYHKRNDQCMVVEIRMSLISTLTLMMYGAGTSLLGVIIGLGLAQ